MSSFKKIEANNKQGYKWMCISNGPPDPITGKRIQVRRRGDTKKEAEALVNKAIADMEESGLSGKTLKNITFEKAAMEWLETYSKGPVKKGTVRIRKNEVATLCGYIGKVTLTSLSLKAYQNILYDLDNKGKAKSTMDGVHITANMIFKYAILNKWIKDNPCTGSVVPVKRRTVEEIENNPIEEKYLENKELEEFLQAARQHGLDYDKEIFYLLAFTGLRSGELCALKWTDVNFISKRIRVTKTLYNEKNNMREFELTPPKTKGSIREFEVDEIIMKMLKAHHKLQSKLKMSVSLFGEEYHNGDFVFCRENGYPFVQKFIQIRMSRLLKKTSIRKAATPHIFRHTHISMLAEAGVILHTIMKRVGHDDPKTTLQIYTHVTEKMQQDSTDKVNHHFSDILNKAYLQG